MHRGLPERSRLPGQPRRPPGSAFDGVCDRDCPETNITWDGCCTASGSQHGQSRVTRTRPAPLGAGCRLL